VASSLAALGGCGGDDEDGAPRRSPLPRGPAATLRAKLEGAWTRHSGGTK
jgi:hypothetical protein